MLVGREKNTYARVLAHLPQCEPDRKDVTFYMAAGKQEEAFGCFPHGHAKPICERLVEGRV